MNTIVLPDYEEYAMKEGLQKGLEKGRSEGRSEGLEKGLQKAILDLLALRFGEVTEDLKKTVRSVHGQSRLDALFKTAATCSDMESFTASL